jgi:hypothetical protein
MSLVVGGNTSPTRVRSDSNAYYIKLTDLPAGTDITSITVDPTDANVPRASLPVSLQLRIGYFRIGWDIQDMMSFGKNLVDTAIRDTYSDRDIACIESIESIECIESIESMPITRRIPTSLAQYMKTDLVLQYDFDFLRQNEEIILKDAIVEEISDTLCDFVDMGGDVQQGYRISHRIDNSLPKTPTIINGALVHVPRIVLHYAVGQHDEKEKLEYFLPIWQTRNPPIENLIRFTGNMAGLVF